MHLSRKTSRKSQSTRAAQKSHWSYHHFASQTRYIRLVSKAKLQQADMTSHNELCHTSFQDVSQRCTNLVNKSVLMHQFKVRKIQHVVLQTYKNVKLWQSQQFVELD